MKIYDLQIQKPIFLGERLYTQNKIVSLLHNEGGEFFLCEYSFDVLSAGKKILPITLEEAKKLVEEHAKGRYEEIFGACEESTPNQPNTGANPLSP